MTISTLVITPSGEVYDEELTHTLPELQKLVGGWIEAIPSNDTRISIFGNEEAKIIGLEPNVYATAVWHAVTPEARGADLICGTVVITGGVDANGNTMTLAADMRDAIVRALTKLGTNA